MLEEKIDRLIQAVEALTAAMTAARPTEATAAPAPVSEVKIAASDVETPKADAPSPQDLKDATLKAARAGHKDAIRTKLDEFGVTKIQDLSSADAAKFYGWVIGLGAAQ